MTDEQDDNLETQTEPMTPREEAVMVIQRLGELSADTRLELQRMGMSIPVLSDGEVALKYGYRCCHCQAIALFFVGSEFVDLDGEVIDRPSTRIPIDMIPWMQELEPHEIRRDAPVCQERACAQPINLVGRMLKERLIVDVEQYIKSRELEQRERELRRRNKARTSRADSETVSVGGVALSNKLDDPEFKDINARLAPEVKDKIRELDKAGMLTMRPMNLGVGR